MKLSPFESLNSTAEPDGSADTDKYATRTEIEKAEYVKSKAEQMSDLILSGKSPEAAARIVAPGSNPHSMESALMKSATIVERNRAMFARVGMEEEAPYKVLFDIMQKATKTQPRTRDGKVVYEKCPDYPARLNAAKQITTLMGLDPRAEMRIQVNNTGGGNSVTQVLIGNAYIEIANHSNPDEQLAAYNEMQRNARQNNYIIVGQSEEEKQGRVMVSAEPDGSGGNG